jgi:hypothetical protein
MRKHDPDNDDAILRIREWQEHRYDPGYYTGGRLHPILTGRRPNKKGYVLIGSAALLLGSAVFTVIYTRDASFLPGLFVGVGISGLMAAAGVKLLRGSREAGRGGPKYRRRRSKHKSGKRSGRRHAK